MILQLKKASDVAMFGGKASNLAFLLNKGVRVPAGWAVSHDNFDNSGHLLNSIDLLLDDNKLYAVRSSATVEDAADKSWAGQFETFLYVASSDVVAKIQECHATYKKRTIAYAAEAGKSTELKVAVVVQEMIDPAYAGVLFTKNPVSGANDLVVEYVKGIGEQLVGGIVTPEQFTWSRKAQKVGSKKTVPFKVDDLARVSLSVEAFYEGVPQDIEWVIDKTGDLWLTQSRPITTLNTVIHAQKSGEVLSKFYETQVPFTEWLEKIGHADTKTMRVENNYKRERLSKIASVVEFPYDKPTTFNAVDLTNRSNDLVKFVAEHGDEACALRLIPKKGIHLEVLRNRGKKIKDVMSWYDKQTIDPMKYTVEFVPHMETNEWSTIFIINDSGIFGEIISGGHNVLTQGFYENGRPSVFTFNFKNWRLEPLNHKALAYLKSIITYVCVENIKKQETLKKLVKAEFTHSYIKGYFETVYSKETGTWFIDYSRTLAKRYQNFKINLDKSVVGLLHGNVASAPIDSVTGIVRIVDSPEGVVLGPDDILVCLMTSPDYIPLMIRAKAIITDQGGILCHAAIVARELKKPCIVGTQNATTSLVDGDIIMLNLLDGTINKDRANSDTSRN